MIRKTVLGLAAAAALAVAMGATASTASAGPKVHIQFGFPAFGYGHVYHAPYGYGAPHLGIYSCRDIVVGYRKVRTHRGWRDRPVYRRVCGY
jgi:hypothetical protein